MKIVLFFVLMCISFLSFSQDKLKHRLIYNSDGTDLLNNYKFPNKLLSIDDVNFYVDELANTQVTTFMMCSGGDLFYYRSKYGRVFGDDKNGTLGCSDTALYLSFKKIYKNFLNLESEGTDIIEQSLSRAKQKGMEAFITYRMNDIHFNDTSMNCSIGYPDYWIEHPEFWLKENDGWHSSGAFDFANDAVRSYKLQIINEQLEKYPMIDGLDLDFLRFMVYFKAKEGKEKAYLMTDLLKSVKLKIDELSEQRGKKILLSVRIPADYNLCLQKGLDVKEWLRLKLVDFVSIGVHWNGNPELPVAEFKKKIGAMNVPLYATIDDGGYLPRISYSHGMYRGMASSILAQGGDGIYLFNYFFESPTAYKKKLLLDEKNIISSVRSPLLLKELGSLATLRKRNKIYCLDDGASAAYGYKPNTNLPLSVFPGKSSSTFIFIGDSVEDDVPEEIILLVETNSLTNIKVYVNNILIDISKEEYIKSFNLNKNLKQDEYVKAFIIPPFCLKQGYNDIRIYNGNNITFVLKKIEIAIKYGSVLTNGFF